jgi:magnesium transporter
VKPGTVLFISVWAISLTACLFNSSRFQRLLPLRRAMTELESDIREAHHAISDAMRSDERVDGLLPRCSRVAYAGDGRNSLNAGGKVAEKVTDASVLEAGPREGSSETEFSEAETVARRETTMRLLQTHLWRIRAAGGQLEEMSRQVEDTRQVWELFLDGVRNRTVRLNLQATIATLALTVTAVPASLFGMNIPSGLEQADPTLFWGVTATLAAVSAATWMRFMVSFLTLFT